MEPIFIRRAKLAAWLDNHSQIVFNLKNQPVAHIANGAVYTYKSEHLGYFDRGFFRDHGGNAVAFIRERSGGPLTVAPTCFATATSPLAPIPPPAPAAPSMPLATILWSALDWEAFVGGVNLAAPTSFQAEVASVVGTRS
jgi:hypothetical protein